MMEVRLNSLTDPTDFVAQPESEREAFDLGALVGVLSVKGKITVVTEQDGHVNVRFPLVDVV